VTPNEFDKCLDKYHDKRIEELFTCCGECALRARRMMDSGDYSALDTELGAPQEDDTEDRRAH